VAVDILEARPTDLNERLRMEQTTNRTNGDVLLNGSTTAERLAREGALEQHGPMPNLANVRDEMKRDGQRIAIFIDTKGIIVNTNLVSAGEAPKSWMDLTDPKWKGKILSDDMRVTGSGQVMFFATYDLYGREYHDKLAKQALTFGRDLKQDALRLARGEYAIYIPVAMADVAGMKGLPVRGVIPSEGVGYVALEASVIKGAPHPNAARLFLNFLIDRDSQMAYARAGLQPGVKGVTDSAPESVRDVLNAKLLGTTAIDRVDEMQRIASEVYGK
jgi:iron(III) transport system substrate-binding protein